MSLFITFEGGEGGGKGVQSRALYRRLVKEGIPALLTHEPGGTQLGEALTRWLKWHPETRLSAETELLLFNASRAHLVNTVIKPALKSGQVVICDRFTDSTKAYQGFGRGLNLRLIETANGIATGGLVPDITFLLDIQPSKGLARKNREKADRFEKEALAFHERVSKGYIAMAHAEPARWYILNGLRLKGETAAIIWEKVSRALDCRRK
jgi:dTMP kinase